MGVKILEQYYPVTLKENGINDPARPNETQMVDKMINSEAIRKLTAIANASRDRHFSSAIHDWISQYVKQFNIEYVYDHEGKAYEPQLKRHAQMSLIESIIAEHEGTKDYLMYSCGAREAGTTFTKISFLVLK